MYESIEEKLILMEKDTGVLSATVIRRKFKVTLEMAIKLKDRFYKEQVENKCH